MSSFSLKFNDKNHNEKAEKEQRLKDCDEFKSPLGAVQKNHQNERMEAERRQRERDEADRVQLEQQRQRERDEADHIKREQQERERENQKLKYSQNDNASNEGYDVSEDENYPILPKTNNPPRQNHIAPVKAKVEIISKDNNNDSLSKVTKTYHNWPLSLPWDAINDSKPELSFENIVEKESFSISNHYEIPSDQSQGSQLDGSNEDFANQSQDYYDCV